MKSFQETYEKDKKQSFKYITRYELKNTLDGYKDIRTRFSFWNFMDKMFGYIVRKIINGFNYGYSCCTSSPYKPTDWMITSNENISNLRSLAKTTPAGNSVSINQIQRALSGQEKETFSNQKQVSPQKEKNKSPSGSIQTLIALRSKMQYPPQTQ
ncbi:MAG: hypothetical protein GY821_00885 [Gammaproteobacteria bacterium]|nr:hypothetical protein [Gammaproteobacteria bacterium]